MNPFENDIVKKPRSIEKSIPGLNENQLNSLLTKFDQLYNKIQENKKVHNFKEHAIPKKVEFVTSVDPGFGKSHLLGRLFQILSGKANLIYISPFMDANTAWKSILNKIINEMDFQDYYEKSTTSRKQISNFAHGILSQLLLSSFYRTKNPNFKKIKSYVNNTQSENISNKFINLIIKRRDDLLTELRLHEINTNFNSKTWINVLIKLAYFSNNIEQYEICKDWLKCNCIDPVEAKKIGISLGTITQYNIEVDTLNENCTNMITDLCHLSGFYRPFLFCFDQTESYGLSPELSRSLGIIIRSFLEYLPNSLTILTSNMHPWEKTIKLHWELAHLHALTNPPIELDGINIDQANYLIKQRLIEIQVNSANSQKMYNQEWLKSIFQDNTIGIRNFINKCKSRWENKENPPTGTEALDQLFTKYQLTIKTNPRRWVYDMDAFMWFVQEMAPSGCEDIQKLGDKYFRYSFKKNGQTLLFGFQDNTNWATWNAIANRCITMHRHQKCGNLIRIFNQTEIPKRTWNALDNFNQAKALGSFSVHSLDKETLIKLYAGYDLYKDAVSQNVDYTHTQVKQFLAQPFAEIWESILHSKPIDSRPLGDNTDALEKKIKKIVSRERFMSLSDLLKQLSGHSEHLVIDMQNKIPELNIYQQTNMSVVVWSQ